MILFFIQKEEGNIKGRGDLCIQLQRFYFTYLILTEHFRKRKNTQ